MDQPESSAEGSRVQSRPEFRSKAGIPTRDQDIGRARVPKHGAHQVLQGLAAVVAVACSLVAQVVGRDEPDATSQKVDVHLKEIMARGRGRHVQEV